MTDSPSQSEHATVAERWATATDNDGWRKSSFSADAQCVELKEVGQVVAVRNSNNRMGGVVNFTRDELGAFIEGAKAGEFDDLTI